MRGQAGLSRAFRAAAVSLTLAAVGCGIEVAHAASARVHGGGVAAEAFLQSHWRRPLKAQATGAEGASVRDSLWPADCGSCHRAQYEDWRTSLHSRAMDAGVVGQLKSMDEADRRDCQRCHAPLREQLDPATSLNGEGLVCAGCHMREGRIYGPRRRDGSTLAASAGMPHGGWTANAAFEDARFCGACHQFDATGLALNGKPLENTVEEWKSSRYARDGRACQSCHMPDRRHLWRGIHDPAMTRAGITIERLPAAVEPGSRLTSGWRIVNSGTGHFFPTYVTPRIVATIRQETGSGKALDGTEVRYVIAREVSADLAEELSDTRIAPGEGRVLRYAMKRHPAATRLVLEIRVEPDALYTALYRSLLEGGIEEPGRGRIREALARSIASRYVLETDRRAIPEDGSAALRP